MADDELAEAVRTLEIVVASTEAVRNLADRLIAQPSPIVVMDARMAVNLLSILIPVAVNDEARHLAEAAHEAAGAAYASSMAWPGLKPSTRRVEPAAAKRFVAALAALRPWLDPAD